MKLIKSIVLIFAISSLLIACQKYNQIDNSRTIKTPYTLFIGGYNGKMEKTNDALYFSTLFPIDGSTVRQVLVADTMLLRVMQNFYYSKDDGKSFKDSKLDVVDYIDKFYKYYIPNPAVYDRVEKKVYLCTKAGLVESSDFGASFQPVTNWTPATPSAAEIAKFRSLTQTDNGTLYLVGDSINHYYKQGTGDWTKVNVTPDNIPRDTIWYVSHSHDTLFLIDFHGKYGVWWSNDIGVNWTKCTGLPSSRKILFGNKPYGKENFYVGLDSGGLYRLNGTQFISSGAGIPWWAKVSFVEGKRIVYRTDVNQYYLFCATDLGLYMSQDADGKDWKLIRQGNFSTLY